MENTQPKNAEKYNHYFRPLRNLTAIDPYVLFRLYEVDCHEIGHAIKKLLSAGRRGAKNREQDLREAMDTIQRCIEIDLVMEHYKMLEKEDNNQLAPQPHCDGVEVSPVDITIDSALPEDMAMVTTTDPITGVSQQVGVVKLVEPEPKIVNPDTSNDSDKPKAKIYENHLKVRDLNETEFEGKKPVAMDNFNMFFASVKEWCDKTKPEVDINNLMVQYAVHIEEFTEMVEETGEGDNLLWRLKQVSGHYYSNSESYKSVFSAMLKDEQKRTKFHDALLDQIWTAIMLGHMIGFDIVEGFAEVVRSNFSKFDENGNPVYKDNGKVGKSELYVEPDLSLCSNVRESVIKSLDFI